jgi:hypothetical protein
MMRCAFVTMAILVAFTGVAAAHPDNVIIVPGVAVGDIRLGMTQAMVLNRLGQPDEMNDEPSGEDTTDIYWMYRRDDDRLLVVSWTSKTDGAGGVDFLYVNSARYLTSKGVRIGHSSFQNVLERYGAPDRMTPTRGGVVLVYETIGIRFGVDTETGLIRAVIVVGRR